MSDKKILVIEDDINILEVIQMRLKSWGYPVWPLLSYDCPKMIASSLWEKLSNVIQTYPSSFSRLTEVSKALLKP